MLHVKSTQAFCLTISSLNFRGHKVRDRKNFMVKSLDMLRAAVKSWHYFQIILLTSQRTNLLLI